jgi:hypothetical protein
VDDHDNSRSQGRRSKAVFSVDGQPALWHAEPTVGRAAQALQNVKRIMIFEWLSAIPACIYGEKLHCFLYSAIIISLPFSAFLFCIKLQHGRS